MGWPGLREGLYDAYLGRVEDGEIREWITQEIEFVESLLDRRGQVGLADLLPEYRWLIESGASYSTAVAHATGPLLYNDVLDKLTTVEYVFAPVYRRVTLDSFRASYGLTPEEYLRLFSENERIVPMSMAPPWSLERPRFYKDILRVLYKKFGYYPPPAWVRITDYFARRLYSIEDLSMKDLLGHWRVETREVFNRDPEGLERLARRHRRAPQEILDITSTKAAQLHLFGYKRVLDIVLEASLRVGSAELLYALVTLYHKYLVSAVLDYVGGVMIWLGDSTPPRKLGIRVDRKALEPLLLRYRVINDNLRDVGIPWKQKLPLSLLNIIDKIRDKSNDYFEFISNINRLAKTDIDAFVEKSRELDEYIYSNISAKISILNNIIKLVSKALSAGIIILLGKILVPGASAADIGYLRILSMAARSILAKLGHDLGEDYIDELVESTIREALRVRVLRDPLGALQGMGIFWIVWSVRDISTP